MGTTQIFHTKFVQVTIRLHLIMYYNGYICIKFMGFAWEVGTYLAPLLSHFG